MKTTTLILSAIVAALPLAANATQTIVQTQTPAAVGSDGTVKKAATSGPYVTIEPSPADQTHIATTAYVKGAYNDAIAAVNKVDSDKQNNLGLSGVMDAGDVVSRTMGVIVNNDNSALANTSDKAVSVYGLIGAIDEYNNYLTNDVVQAKLFDGETGLAIGTSVVGASDIFSAAGISTESVLYYGMSARDLRDEFISPQGGWTDRLTTAAGVISSVAAGAEATKNYTDSKRVRIYTTWGTDTVAATTLVPFEMAQ